MKSLSRSHVLISVCGLAVMASLLAGCGGGAAANASSPTGADGTDAKPQVKGTYAFWPLAPDEPRIQFIRTLKGSEDLAPSKTKGFDSLVFGKQKADEAEVEKPYGVALHAGKVYLCDMRGASLAVFDIAKKQMRLLGTTGANRLTHPVAVAVAADGMIYVADNERGGIVVFDAQERFSQVFGAEKFKPVGLAVSGDRLLATDLTSQTVIIFDRRSGKEIRRVGKVGDGDGEFRVPLGIAVDKQGNFYVADMMRCRVQKFSAEGSFLGGFGTMGDSAGKFARPKHLSVDADGIIYVVDAAFQNVQMFDDQFRLLMAFGAVGNFPGSMDLPAGIAVAEDVSAWVSGEIHPGFAAKRVVAVTNQFGDKKVSLYAMGGLAKGYTTAELSKAATEVSSGVGIEEEILKIQQALPPNADASSAAVAPAKKPGQAQPTPAPAPVTPR